MMKVVVAVPWRPTPDRLRPFMCVRDWYANNFPDWLFGTADSSHDPFNRAGSRNACVRLAEEAGADVVVVNDADTIPDALAVEEAVIAARDGHLHFGLDTMLYLTEEETFDFYRGVMPTREALMHDSSVIAIRPDAYWRAGGQDERFTGWGGEDNSFQIACETILGTSRWHRGTAMSLHHDGACRDIGSERWRVANSAPLQRYLAVRHNRVAMLALINEPGRLSASASP